MANPNGRRQDNDEIGRIKTFNNPAVIRDYGHQPLVTLQSIGTHSVT